MTSPSKIKPEGKGIKEQMSELVGDFLQDWSIYNSYAHNSGVKPTFEDFFMWLREIGYGIKKDIKL